MNASLSVLTSASQCIACPSGTYCSVGSLAATKCAPGTYSASERQPTCSRCPAGTFQDAEGQTSCKPCEPGYFCPQGATTGQPCKGGTYANRTGLESAKACTPVLAGYWAPLGSALPEPCPASGFYCPGAASDSRFGGSLPIELATGSSSTIEEVEVVEQEMTLDISIEEYNETAVKLELALLYGVPPEYIELGATPGSLQLKITIKPPPASAGESASSISLTDIVASMQAVDSSSITRSLSTALGTNITVTVSPPQQKTVAQVAQKTAPAGAWTTAGKIIPCPVGYYNPLPGQTYSGACLPCPQYSTTLNESSTSISQCLCLQGFEKSIVDGNPVCECAAGLEINDGSRCRYVDRDSLTRYTLPAFPTISTPFPLFPSLVSCD